MKTIKEIKELLKSYKDEDISYTYVSRELRRIGIKESIIEIELAGNFNIKKTAKYFKGLI